MIIGHLIRTLADYDNKTLNKDAQSSIVSQLLNKNVLRFSFDGSEYLHVLDMVMKATNPYKRLRGQ